MEKIIRIEKSGEEIRMDIEKNDTPKELIEYHLKQNDIQGENREFALKVIDSQNCLINNEPILSQISNENKILLLFEISKSNLPQVIEKKKGNKKSLTKTGSFFLGSGLIVLGVVDAATNPFAFVTAPELFGAGATLIGISVFGKKEEV